MSKPGQPWGTQQPQHDHYVRSDPKYAMRDVRDLVTRVRALAIEEALDGVPLPDSIEPRRDEAAS